MRYTLSQSFFSVNLKIYYFFILFIFLLFFLAYIYFLNFLCTYLSEKDFSTLVLAIYEGSKLLASFLSSQAKSLWRETIDQYASHCAVKQAKSDAHQSENKSRHPKLHHKKTDQISHPQHNLVSAAFDFCPRVIWL